MKAERIPSIEPLWIAGLTEQILREVALRGEMLRDSATANDPPGRGGYDAWAEGVRALRDQLLPLGWTRDDTNNLSVAVSPCGGHAITVSSGNSDTGLPKASPQTKRPKGEATIFAVECNQMQLFPNTTFKRTDQRLTWILLVHRASNTDVVRCELSLPAQMTATGVICAWKVRHIIEPIHLDDPQLRDEAPRDEGDDIDVDVRRKS